MSIVNLGNRQAPRRVSAGGCRCDSASGSARMIITRQECKILCTIFARISPLAGDTDDRYDRINPINPRVPFFKARRSFGDRYYRRYCVFRSAKDLADSSLPRSPAPAVLIRRRRFLSRPRACSLSSAELRGEPAPKGTERIERVCGSLSGAAQLRFPRDRSVTPRKRYTRPPGDIGHREPQESAGARRRGATPRETEREREGDGL